MDRYTFLYFESRQVGKSNRKSGSMGKLWNGASLSGRDIGMELHMTTRNSYPLHAFLPRVLQSSESEMKGLSACVKLTTQALSTPKT